MSKYKIEHNLPARSISLNGEPFARIELDRFEYFEGDFFLQSSASKEYQHLFENTNYNCIRLNFSEAIRNNSGDEELDEKIKAVGEYVKGQSDSFYEEAYLEKKADDV